MKPAPLPPNEGSRLASLEELQILDTLPEEQYDDVTRIASEITGTPIALLTLIDENRQWFKSQHGFGLKETPRELSFCAHAILDTSDIFIVNDARYDERFHDNPLTLGESPVIFYAGVPVVDAIGNALGTICVIDNRPRELADHKIEALKALAKLVKALFEVRKVNFQMQKAQKEITKVHSYAGIIEKEINRFKPDFEKTEGPSESFKILEDALQSLKEIGEE